MVKVADPATIDTPPAVDDVPVDLPAGATALPGGQWVVLADWHDALGGGAYKAIMGTLRAGATWGASSIAMREKLLELLITNWSLPEPLPATAAVTDGIRDLQIVRALLNLPQITEAFNMCNGMNITPVLSRAAMADPASPTTGSGE